jgi:simple sugar transport system permease protein
MFLSYSFLVFVAIAVALLATFILNKTRMGLQLRAVGESPETADATGVNVTKYKYLATIIGSAIAGLGGLYFIMDYNNGVWSNNGFGERGWLSIALVIFAMWRPSLSIIGSILFGLLYVVPTYIDNVTISPKFFEMLPYAVTIIVLIITSMRKKREHQPPGSLGLNYFREER